MKCLECQNETSNAKFCSVRCCCLHRNRNFKRPQKKEIACKGCGKILKAQKRKVLCDQCGYDRINYGAHTTLGDLLEKVKGKGQHPSFRWGEVRYHCRRTNAFREKCCQVCGYSTHVEFCHIKSLASLPPETTLQAANDPSNVAILCPNHHWEFDHGLLKIN